MFVYELPVGTDVCIHAYYKELYSEFHTSVTDVNDDTLYLNPIKHAGKSVDFSNNKVHYELTAVVNGTPIKFRPVFISSTNSAFDNKNYAVTSPFEGIVDNRRRTPRFVINKNCIFSLGEHKSAVKAVLHDISMTGFSVICGSHVEVGSNIRVAVKFENLVHQVILEAVVVRSEPYKDKFCYGCDLQYDNQQLNSYIMSIQRSMLRVGR